MCGPGLTRRAADESVGIRSSPWRKGTLRRGTRASEKARMEPVRTGEAETEATLRARFDLREERFAHAGFSIDVLLPRAADALIDEAEFEADERMPYWADLWPSARALARHLLEHPPREQRIVELGAGLSLPSLALRGLGLHPLATDYYGDALRFAEVNAVRNGLAPLRTEMLDWRHPPPGATGPGQRGRRPLTGAAGGTVAVGEAGAARCSGCFCGSPGADGGPPTSSLRPEPPHTAVTTARAAQPSSSGQNLARKSS